MNRDSDRNKIKARRAGRRAEKARASQRRKNLMAQRIRLEREENQRFSPLKLAFRALEEHLARRYPDIPRS